MFDLRRINRVDTKDAKAMGNYYGVSSEEYERGQKWVRENLLKRRPLRFVAGISKGSLAVTPIEALDLSVRVFNSLKRVGINTAGDVLELLEGDQKAMMSIRNFSEKSLEELRQKMHEKGFLKIG